MERLVGAMAVVDRLPPSPEARALRTRLELREQIDDVMRLLVERAEAI